VEAVHRGSQAREVALVVWLHLEATVFVETVMQGWVVMREQDKAATRSVKVRIKR